MRPTVDIKYAKMLDPIFIAYVHSMRPHIEVPSPGLVRERVKKYRKIWFELGARIVDGIVEVTGLQFTRNYIPVYVVSLNPRDFSAPLVLKSRYSREEFICAITHELIHCLFTDNSSIFTDPFPENSHRLIHAILKYIYLDILKEKSLLEVNMKTSFDPEYAPGNKDYIEAWNFIEEKGYKEIISSLQPPSRQT